MKGLPTVSTPFRTSCSTAHAKHGTRAVGLRKRRVAAAKFRNQA